MTDNSIPSPMSMVKVDGAKIKRLREEQGLTQLYLATAVQVTTDTISRWENRRYPSIKKENGIKLAEALNVGLEDLLEEEVATDGEARLPDDVSSALPGKAETKPTFRRIWPLLILALILLGIILVFFRYPLQSPESVVFSAERLLPGHCIAGQPFPVIIKVSGDPEESSAMIIRENVPLNSTIVKISPKVSSGNLKNKTIKWLRNIKGTETFAYVVKVKGKEEESVSFVGTASAGSDSETSPQPIAGNATVTIGQHHWADADKDNVISDSEILSIYDQYRDIKDIDLDIDLIEEIWLGSGYKWNPGTATFEILE
jgi:transcriptional regulator with XRE-family HTH domain